MRRALNPPFETQLNEWRQFLSERDLGRSAFVPCISGKPSSYDKSLHDLYYAAARLGQFEVAQVDQIHAIASSAREALNERRVFAKQYVAKMGFVLLLAALIRVVAGYRFPFTSIDVVLIAMATMISTGCLFLVRRLATRSGWFGGDSYEALTPTALSFVKGLLTGLSDGDFGTSLAELKRSEYETGVSRDASRRALVSQFAGLILQNDNALTTQVATLMPAFELIGVGLPAALLLTSPMLAWTGPLTG